MNDRILHQMALAESIASAKTQAAKRRQIHLLCVDLIAMLKVGRVR